MNTLQRQARLFRLVRAAATPASRVLAEGAEWSDGAVAVRWLERPHTSTWDGIGALLEAHSGPDDAQLRWLAPPPQVRPSAPLPSPSDPLWLPSPTSEGLCSRCGRPWPCLSCGP